MSHPSEDNPLLLSISGATNRGNRRSQNEDSFIAEYPVFLVADGMGGHDAGDIASSTVIECFRPFVGRDSVSPEEIADTIDRAQRVVGQLARTKERGAGATLTGVIASRNGLGERTWIVVNMGDSRTYRIAADGLQQLTVDHSLQQEFLASGRPDAIEAASLVTRNVITRAIGDGVSHADFWALPFVNGERILVCSDGLTTEVTDDVVADILATYPSVEQTAVRLVDAALDNQGRDNVTVIVIEVLEGGRDAGWGPSDWYSFEARAVEDDGDTNTVPRERSDV